MVWMPRREPPAEPRSIAHHPPVRKTTRTTAPASLTSMIGVAAARAAVTGTAASVTIGTKSAACDLAAAEQAVDRSCRAARRQPNTCCGQTCQRRATADTRAPGARVSSTIRDFSSADQRRRRPGPVRSSTRRKPPFASSLTSNITIARSPLLQANPPRLAQTWKEGAGPPLTIDRPCSEISCQSDRAPLPYRSGPPPTRALRNPHCPIIICHLPASVESQHGCCASAESLRKPQAPRLCTLHGRRRWVEHNAILTHVNVCFGVNS